MATVVTGANPEARGSEPMSDGCAIRELIQTVKNEEVKVHIDLVKKVDEISLRGLAPDCLPLSGNVYLVCCTAHVVTVLFHCQVTLTSWEARLPKRGRSRSRATWDFASLRCMLLIMCHLGLRSVLVVWVWHCPG